MFRSYLPHPNSELCTIFIFYFWIPYSSRNIVSKFENFSQLVDQIGKRFNQFVKYFFRWSTGSLGLLVNGFVFGIFGALVQAGSSPGSPDGLGGWFYVKLEPFFRLIATHLESIWILSG